ncbi:MULTISPECIES: TauD/TfdA dioxygenase family protein [Rhodococcus]|uniref:TauD/TfdA dioxygenase family protein n=1 Tax=Rhodococcus TaxID=1827 RepID=UPI001C57EEDD|nr:TauD/TfdA family dioxygenase [Rhodococcus sp. LW-XY12]QXU55584.1 TauD/TfdA family dioxygenase [Rhodococcus sp. LW-XY12]
MTTSDIRVVRLAKNIGAQIEGVRLAGDLAPDVVRLIHETWLEHKVIFFRDQDHLTEEGQHEFAKLFGILPKTAHPTVQDKADKIFMLDSKDGAPANVWHSDLTSTDRPPKAAILRAVSLPPYGGTTIWASTTAAYNQLPEELKLLADNLWALHTDHHDYQTAPEALENYQALSVADREQLLSEVNDYLTGRFATEHPVVRVHPETGERALLLGGLVDRILNVSESESRALLRIFQDRITTPENSIRWSWRIGDVAMWDNRATQHYAVADYDHRRIMHRIAVAGDVPVGVDGQRSRVLKGDASTYSDLDIPAGLVSVGNE